MAIELNDAPDIDTFCKTFELPPDGTGLLRLMGGFDMQAQINPNQGPPGSCGLSLDLMGNVQGMLAVFQPLFDVIDLVAQTAAIAQLITECLSNPLKFADLIVAVLNLTGKVNKVLALVPPLPQGLVRAIGMALDILRLCSTQLDCLVTVLTSIQAELNALADLASQLNEVDDEQLRAQLQVQIDCAQASVEVKIDTASAAFGPVARLLCFARALLILADPKDEKGLKTLAKQLQIPDPSNINVLGDVISVLATVQGVLQTAIEVVRLIGTPLGLAPPSLIFTCPLDTSDDDEGAVPLQPVLLSATEADGVTPLISIPQAASVNDPPATVTLIGGGFDAASKVFWNTAQIDASAIQQMSSRQLLVQIPAALRLNVGSFLFSVANEPTGGPTPFSGISAIAGQLGETDIKISELLEVEVV
jgi:hypothetical protein